MSAAARAPALALGAPLTSATRRSRSNDVPLRSRGRQRGFGIRAPACSGSHTFTTQGDSSVLVKKRASEMYGDLKGTSIFLLGMKCAMKSSSGKLLADALRYYYFDIDSLVEQALGGESAAKLLKETDERSYFESETEVLKQLSSMGHLVVSAGDGAVQNSANLALLRYGISVWIDVPLEFLVNEASNTGNSADARLIPGSSELLDDFLKQYNEMKEGYGTADATVSLQKVASKRGLDSLELITADDIALEVLEQVERLIRVKKMMEDAARPF